MWPGYSGRDWSKNMLKYISYTLVQSFSQVDPFLLLDLFENLDISGHFFKITVLIFHYVGRKLPYFSYFEQKSQKIPIPYRWSEREEKWVNLKIVPQSVLLPPLVLTSWQFHTFLQTDQICLNISQFCNYALSYHQ